MDKFKVVMTGEIVNEVILPGETVSGEGDKRQVSKTFSDQSAALKAFSEMVGGVYETILAEEGFCDGICATGFDGSDLIGDRRECFAAVMESIGEDGEFVEDWTSVKFTTGPNVDIGRVVLVVYLDE